MMQWMQKQPMMLTQMDHCLRAHETGCLTCVQGLSWKRSVGACARLSHQLDCFGTGLVGQWAKQRFMGQAACTFVRPRSLLWQSQLKNKTRIPQVPDVHSKAMHLIAVVLLSATPQVVYYVLCEER